MQVEILGGTVEIDESHVEESSAEIRRQFREYERDERQTFDLSIDVPETFTGAVMEQLPTISYGETRTYGEIAAALDTAPIAVGGACGRNLVRSCGVDCWWRAVLRFCKPQLTCTILPELT